jgi:hypothetical protein
LVSWAAVIVIRTSNHDGAWHVKLYDAMMSSSDHEAGPRYAVPLARERRGRRAGLPL